jgi:hypothetical protein
MSKSGEEITGLVEEVGTEQRRSFQSIAGLVTTLRQLVGREKSLQTDVRMLYPENTVVKAE